MGTIDGVPTTDAYDAGAYADGDTVKDDLTAIVAEVNGSIDTINIADAAITTEKLGASSVTTGKVAANAVREAHVNYKKDDSGVLVWRSGPDYVGANGGRIARIQKTIAFTATENEEPFTINLNDATTDCLDGNPGFSDVSQPIMMGSPIVTSSDEVHAHNAILSARITAIDEGSITIYLAHGNTAANVVIEFCVAGEVA